MLKNMPVNIYKNIVDGEPEDIAWLCDGSWDLCEQMEALESWLKVEGQRLKPGDYVADVGISVRTGADAGGGGAAFPPDAMRVMADIEMHLFLSEYPSG